MPDWVSRMTYFKKIHILVKNGLNKLIFLVSRRFDLIEVKILTTGLILLALGGLFLSYLLFTDISLYRAMSSTAIIHLMGGRALGIAKCLSADLSLPFTIIYNFYIEVVIVLIAYGIVVLIMRNIIQPKLLHSAVRQAELTAQSQKTKIKKFGAIGLFLFVMFPFMMTGPVVGSIIGYLLNYKARNNFLIVFSGTLTSIIIYALIGNNIIHRIRQYVDIEKIETWGGIIISLLIVIFLIYHIGTVKAYLDGEDE